MSMNAAAAVALCDKSDPTRLTHKELQDGYGGPRNFMESHGLKPSKQEDCAEALAISRALKDSFAGEATAAKGSGGGGRRK